MRPHLHLVTGGSPRSDDPDDPPVPTDAEALENRVLLQRLADGLQCVQTPDRPLPADDVLIAVFDRDAMPELAGLLVQRRSRR